MPLGPNAEYLAQYNTYVLPGYVQDESFDSVMNIANHQAAYADGSNSEMTGLQNKVLSLKLKVWEPDYQSCKDQVQKAGTILRTKKNGFAELYVQYSDRHYEAMVQSIKVGKVAGTTVKTLDYQVDFSCRPWLVSNASYTISGSAMNRQHQVFSTSQVARDIDDGGWTYTSILVSGRDITISGYTPTESFTGFISISGTVANMLIDAQNYTATINDINANDRMRWADYRTFVGPEQTLFSVSGAEMCEITYNNRWYL